MRDHDAWIGLLNRDEDALYQIMEHYSPLMWAIGSKYFNQGTSEARQEIEELMSDVFLRLWRQPKGYEPAKGSLKTYLGMMTRSMALNRLKARKRHESVSLLDELLVEERTMDDRIDWQDFYEAVMMLEEPTREIIVKRYFLEMKPSEIQEETGYDAKLIDNRLYYGKKQLQKLMLFGGE